jgi:hypothetical protein
MSRKMGEVDRVWSERYVDSIRMITRTALVEV